ncbi:MAG: hypothetical protein ABI871_07465 [Chthoniobacterales bacterium]
MAREIQLGGGEITLLKSIGLSGSPILGKLLLERVDAMEKSELVETLAGLISTDYVLTNRVNVRTVEDVEKGFFRVNPAHTKDLRDAVNPGRRREQDRSKRERRR